MIKNNNDIFKAGAELYHRLVETKEIKENHAIAGAKLLTVLQRSIMIDIAKERSGSIFFPVENQKKVIEEKMFVKRV